VQPKCHTQNLHQGQHSDREGHNCSPKGLGSKASESGVHDAHQLPPFWALNDIIRYTVKELLNIATHHATYEETVGPILVPGGREVVLSSSRVAPSNIVVQGTKKDAKGGKKR
jgi:hypothetical protein